MKNEKYLSVFKLSRFTRKYISGAFFEIRIALLGYDLDAMGRVAVLPDYQGIVAGLLAGSSMYRP